MTAWLSSIFHDFGSPSLDTVLLPLHRNPSNFAMSRWSPRTRSTYSTGTNTAPSTHNPQHRSASSRSASSKNPKKNNWVSTTRPRPALKAWPICWKKWGRRWNPSNGTKKSTNCFLGCNSSKISRWVATSKKSSPAGSKSNRNINNPAESTSN